VFGTFTGDLLELVDWLKELGVTHVAMEATRIYWRPAWAVLEGQVEQMLVDPQHIKAVPVRKTDARDCEWIAVLLQHGLLKGSFVPPTPIQDLRDLTRYRAELRQSQNRAKRIQKFLEQANLKLSSVARMHGGGESSDCIVPTKCANQGGETSAERTKGRRSAEETSRHRWTPSQRTPVHYNAGETRAVGQRLGAARSEVGTVCVSSASTGLCGGRRETAVPTATTWSRRSA